MSTIRIQAPFLRKNRLVGPATGTKYPVDRQGYADVQPQDADVLLLQGWSRPADGPRDVVGTAATGVTAVEYGDEYMHTTVLTVDTVLPPIAGGADLAIGKLLYTLPAGAILIEGAHMSLAITQTDDNITADTPDGGLGTTIASGAVAVLGGTAAFENILTGQTFDDCDGTPEVKTVDTRLVIEASDDHTVYFNVADGWASDGDAGALLTGTVVLRWSKMSA